MSIIMSPKPPQSNENYNNNIHFSYKPKTKCEEKFEYDLSDDQVPIIEKITNTKIDYNIGSGGFSVVKLVHSPSYGKYYALKVVKIIFHNY